MTMVPVVHEIAEQYRVEQYRVVLPVPPLVGIQRPLPALDALFPVTAPPVYVPAQPVFQGETILIDDTDQSFNWGVRCSGEMPGHTSTRDDYGGRTVRFDSPVTIMTEIDGHSVLLPGVTRLQRDQNSLTLFREDIFADRGGLAVANFTLPMRDWLHIL